MKLIRHKSREYKGKKYYKHWVVIPNKLVEELGWKQGEDLEAYTDFVVSSPQDVTTKKKRTLSLISKRMR